MKDKVNSVRVARKHTPTAAEKREKEAKRAAIRRMNQSSINIANYLKKYELDPDKDWRKDPEHGPTINKFLKEMQENKMKLDPALKQHTNKVGTKKTKPVAKGGMLYDYPEGLDVAQRKRFRFKMRRLLRANAEVSEATQKALLYALGKEALPEKKKEVIMGKKFLTTAKLKKKINRESKEAERTQEVVKKKKKKVVKKKREED